MTDTILLFYLCGALGSLLAIAQDIWEANWHPETVEEMVVGYVTIVFLTFAWPLTWAYWWSNNRSK